MELFVGLYVYSRKKEKISIAAAFTVFILIFLK